ncbi:MAG: lipopolysaccharide heptosyltransferase II [Planctomycetota bacterium]
MKSGDQQAKPSPKRILVVLPSWVGDLVMATPTLRALREHFADASITLLTRPALTDLIDGGGWADQVMQWEPKRRARRGESLVALARQLRRRRFDWAVLLTNSFRSALLSRLAGVPRRIGYDRDGRGLLLTDRLAVTRVNGEIAVTRMVDYYGRLAEHLGAPPPGDKLNLVCDSESDQAIERRLRRLGIAEQTALVVISPGASFGASKLWLPERFAEVGDRLIDAHGAAVVVSCAPGEQETARRIGRMMSREAHILDDPVTTLGEFKSLIRRCDLSINNDTGPRHIAKAFGVPIVTIFGPTHPGWTETYYAPERKVSVPVDCGPCQKKACPLDHRCMTGVTVEMVVAAADELLAARRGEATVQC